MCGRCSAPQKSPRWVFVSPLPAAPQEPPVPTVGVYQSVLLLQLLGSSQPPRWVSTRQSSSCSFSGAPSPHGGCLPVSSPPAAPLEPPAPTMGVYQSVLLLQLLWSPQPPRWVSTSQFSSCSSSGAPSPHDGCLPVSPPPAAPLEPPAPMMGVYQSVLLLQLLWSPQSPRWVSTSRSSSCSSSGAPTMGVYQSVLLLQLLWSPQPPHWVLASHSSFCYSSPFQQKMKSLLSLQSSHSFSIFNALPLVSCLLDITQYLAEPA